MATHADQPGWRPDPEKPGSLRWWNGLGWSDAWRTAGQAVERERAPVQAAAQGSTIRRTRGAPVGASLARTNPVAGLAPLIGLVGLGAGFGGIVPLAGIVVALLGLALSRRVGGRDARSGRPAALLGLLLSVLGLLRWLPALLALVPGLQDALN